MYISINQKFEYEGHKKITIAVLGWDEKYFLLLSRVAWRKVIVLQHGQDISIPAPEPRCLFPAVSCAAFMG
ncbi:MAG: hypothetical protein C3F07_06345 [Anaerolineales bacterium]|nr:MAG: hypothetical protein C3F07_06345 [Anaerolineales bacterium]